MFATEASCRLHITTYIKIGLWKDGEQMGFRKEQIGGKFSIMGKAGEMREREMY